MTQELEREIAALRAENAALKDQITHEAFDHVEAMASYYVVITERLMPMASDIIDALEIEPPAIKAAIGRARTIIGQARDITNRNRHKT